jgi:hypothetical protein
LSKLCLDGIFTSFAFALSYFRAEAPVKVVKIKAYHLNKVPHG